MGRSVVQVRRGSITTLLDGKVMLSYKTDWSEFSDKGDGKLRVGAWNSPTTFHSIQIIEVTGQGRAALPDK